MMSSNENGKLTKIQTLASTLCTCMYSLSTFYLYLTKTSFNLLTTNWLKLLPSIIYIYTAPGN